MPSYQLFTVARLTEPYFPTLLAQLKGLDASAGVVHAIGSKDYVLKKATAWTGPQITAAQNVLETAPVVTDRLLGQDVIDTWPIAMRALLLVLIDELNRLRTQPTTAFGAITPAQAIAATRAKADTL